MRNWEAGTVVNPSVSPAAAVFMVGNMIPSWMPTFKGEIAEIRVYDRALTDRERSRVQFELCARYGVHWAAHGDIDNNALAWCETSAQFGRVTGYGVSEDLVSSVSSGGATFTLGTASAAEGARGYFANSGGNGLSRTWCANGAQFGYWEGDGLPEALVTTATAGGATLTLDQTPAASAYTRGYLAHNGGDGLERVWFVSAAAAAQNLPMTLAIDACVVGGRTFALDRSDSLDGPRTRVGAYTAPVNGLYVFPFNAGGWQGGVYHLRKQKAFTLVIR